MDPTATLEMIRNYIKRLRAWEAGGTGDDITTIAEGLGEYTEALDEWIMKGGYLPKDWYDANERYRTS